MFKEEEEKIVGSVLLLTHKFDSEGGRQKSALIRKIKCESERELERERERETEKEKSRQNE